MWLKGGKNNFGHGQDGRIDRDLEYILPHGIPYISFTIRAFYLACIKKYHIWPSRSAKIHPWRPCIIRPYAAIDRGIPRIFSSHWPITHRNGSRFFSKRFIAYRDIFLLRFKIQKGTRGNLNSFGTLASRLRGETTIFNRLLKYSYCRSARASDVAVSKLLRE